MVHDRSIITPFSVMSDPHISAGGSSEDIKKDNIPPTSSNSLLGALSLPADHTFGHISESSDCEKEEEELGLKDTSAKDMKLFSLHPPRRMLQPIT